MSDTSSQMETKTQWQCTKCGTIHDPDDSYDAYYCDCVFIGHPEKSKDNWDDWAPCIEIKVCASCEYPPEECTCQDSESGDKE